MNDGSNRPTSWDAAEIRERIAQLRAGRNSARVFGADAHRFHLATPVSPEELTRFEARHNFRMPENFAWFLTQLGNGGAGPGYGLFPIGMMDGPHNHHQPWHEHLVGDLSRPFPHSQPWNRPAADLTPPEGLSPEQQAEWFDEKEKTYFSRHLMDGAIPISHLGCATRVYLVVNGVLAGQVWTDDRASDQGIYPCEPTDFITWYLTWLDAAEHESARLG